MTRPSRLLVVSLVVGIVAALAPWNGASATTPRHRADVMIKLPGEHWVGKGVYAKPARQRVVGVLSQTPGRAVAVIRVVNTGTAPIDLDVWASSIRETFYGGVSWPEEDSLAPGEAVSFRYVAHRGSAEDGATMPVDITLRRGDRIVDGVRFLLAAR